MGQQEICDFLKAHPGRWYTAKEISEEINAPTTNVSTPLKALRKNELLLFKKVPLGKKKKPTFQYKFKE